MSDQDPFDRWWNEARVKTGDMLTWLQNQSPEEWHLATVATSHDGDHEMLEWVTAEPECELSTALTIFWMGAPWDSLRDIYIPDRMNREDFHPLEAHVRTFELQRKIVERLNAGFYTRRRISFPPPETPGFTVNDLIEHRRAHKIAIDEVMAKGFPRHGCFRHGPPIHSAGAVPNRTTRSKAAKCISATTCGANRTG